MTAVAQQLRDLPTLLLQVLRMVLGLRACLSASSAGRVRHSGLHSRGGYQEVGLVWLHEGQALCLWLLQQQRLRWMKQG